MSKYSNEFKLKVVEYCINEHHGYLDAAKHFNIKGDHTVLKWVRIYNAHENIEKYSVLLYNYYVNVL